MTLVTKHDHPLVNVLIDRIAEQKAMRLAWDGQYYTRDEFLDTYGEEVGLQFWREAPHYGCLEDFKREWGVHALRSNGGGYVELAHAACMGEFGVLFPGLLLLVPVAHLHGKLKPSLLAPVSENWELTKNLTLWDDGLVIGVQSRVGHRVGTVHVADFRKDLEVAALGKKEMDKAAADFLNFLDGTTLKGLGENPIMKFLSVSTPEDHGDSDADDVAAK